MRELRAASPLPQRHRLPLLLLLRRLVGWTAAAMLPMQLGQRAFSQGTPAARIVTVAGNGTAGYVPSQEGGPATLAELDEPFGTAIDATGNLFIAERANHRIRRVDAVTGSISTVAGNGQAGYRNTDEGAPATAAELNGPRAVAVDAVGNLYIADTGNHRIRRVDRQGIIRTIAGNGTAGFRLHDEFGSAVMAELDSPRAVAVDLLGDVYLSDYNNQRIRKIESTTHVIHTVAGTGTPGYLAAQGGGPAAEAELNEPYGIAIDNIGNLYIADTGNHRIRRVEAQTGLITTIAGDGTPGYRASDEGKLATRAHLSAPCGIALDRVGNLYIADMEEHRVRRVDAGTHTISTAAGAGFPGYIVGQDGELATDARLNQPRAVAVDPGGNVYIADSANSRVRRVEVYKPSVFVAGR